jgi:hypothetical protein
MRTTVLLLTTLLLAAELLADDVAAEGVVRVGMLTYADGRTGVCFSAGFLDLIARRTDIRVHRTFDAVDLAADDLYRYPFLVMSGEQAFTLSDDEIARLRDYVERGGFILASAGCSNAAWAESFRKLVAAAFPNGSLQRMPMDHPLFATLYDIREIVGRKPFEGDALLGLTLGPAAPHAPGRLALLFSPLGLNDTANAGGGCCCCGGNELRNAAQINANALVYALTH